MEDLLKDVRVLVVEDDHDTREMIQFVLERSGAAVVSADTVIAAIEAYNEVEPHVVVADIAMPDYNGYALIARIREDDKKRGKVTPAMVLTAFATPADKERAFSAGFQAYLSKPFDPAALVQNIAQLVRRAPPGGTIDQSAA